MGEVRGLALSASGEIFLCTRVNLYRKADGDAVPVQILLPVATGVRAIAVSGTTLWLDTLDDGVWSMSLDAGARAQPYARSEQSGGISILEGHGSARRVHQLGTAEGLPNLNVDKLLQSPSGDVWAATDNGLAVIDAASLKVRSLGRAEGVAIFSYWVNAGAVATDGTLGT